MTTTVTIGVNEQLWETLTQPDFDALLDWFRRNGIDPADIPIDQQVRIARGTIDYWSIGDKRPGGTTVLELRSEFDDRFLQHLVSPVVEEMDEGLAERVHALWVARVEGNAQIAAKVAGAHAAAEYRDKAGL